MKVDREFFSVGMINLLESLKILFMVPAIKTKGVKKAVNGPMLVSLLQIKFSDTGVGNGATNRVLNHMHSQGQKDPLIFQEKYPKNQAR